MRPGEGDADNGDGEQHRREEVRERQPPAGQDEPQDIAENPKWSSADVLAASIFSAGHCLLAERQ